MANFSDHNCRFDDLIEEETDIVQKALKRLSPKESYDRVFRLRRAVQLSYQHKLLPKNEWTKPEEVNRTPTRNEAERRRTDMQQTGQALPDAPHRADPGRGGREAGLRDHGGPEEAPLSPPCCWSGIVKGERRGLKRARLDVVVLGR